MSFIEPVLELKIPYLTPILIAIKTLFLDFRYFIAVSINIICGLWRYYIIKDTTAHNFVVNKRLSHYTVYKDGTLIVHNTYNILMLSDGDFKINKNHKTENPDRVDMKKFKKIYEVLDSGVEENRFSDFLAVASLINGKKQGSRFYSEIKEDECTSEKFEYSIKYTNLNKFDRFSFFVFTTIPKEFARESKKDGLIMTDIYGEYEFHFKIDKQSKDSGKFSPKLIDNGKEQKPKHSDSIFYIGSHWKLYNPKNGKIEIK